MNKILVPTDFSSSSKFALQFAEELSKILDLDIDLLHVYHTKMAEMEGMLTEIEGYKYYKSQINQMANASPLKDRISTSVLEGFAVDVILPISGNYDCIVMGSKGQGALKKILGSVSIELAKAASCPVIIIPEGHKRPQIKTIGYAYDDGIDCAYQISNLLKSREVQIFPFHVVEQNGGDPRIFETLNVVKLGDKHFEVHADKVDEGINAICSKMNLDAVIMEREKHSFFDMLFTKSDTITALRNVKTPIIILHE